MTAKERKTGPAHNLEKIEIGTLGGYRCRFSKARKLKRHE